ncbi:ATP-binding protein [uncultured Dubosiella sp.]|uniref:ATP-binding protein n=1 Tax=uncultured Dubosiella sp. TaxID=1937011 RepID=UPI00258632CD|nr:ATP-binding protein [uncultured Dubosiella sp.]
MKDFQIKLDPAQQARRFEQIQKLKENKLVVDFMRRNHMPMEVLEKHSSQFLSWVERVAKCQGCQGLRYCRQPLKGRLQMLDVDADGYLTDVYKACRYEQDEEKQLAHRRNYKIFDGSYADLLLDENSIHLGQESNEYTEVFVAMTDYETEKGMYLYGQPGTGKTYLSRVAANHYAKAGQTVCFVNMPQCIQSLKQNMTDSRFRMTMLSRMKFCDVLFLDDIGSESISAWTRDEILFPILEYRMNNRLKTYFTSNYTLEELKKQYAKVREESAEVASMRILERIRSLAVPCGLYGPSRR